MAEADWSITAEPWRNRVSASDSAGDAPSGAAQASGIAEVCRWKITRDRGAYAPEFFLTPPPQQKNGVEGSGKIRG